MAMSKNVCSGGNTICIFYSSIRRTNIKGLGTPDVDDIEYPDDEPHSDAEIDLGKKLFLILAFPKITTNLAPLATILNSVLVMALIKGLGLVAQN